MTAKIKSSFKRHFNLKMFFGAIFTMVVSIGVTAFAYNNIHELILVEKIKYYQEEDIDTFFKLGYIQANDACVGDNLHTWTSERYINPEFPYGLQAALSRELFRVKGEGQLGKVYDEYAIVQIEQRDGPGTRSQFLPSDLTEGKYRWNVASILYLPYNVMRTDVPISESTIFSIKKCE